MRALLWLAATVFVLAAKPALAAMSAPMCGVHAQTVAAPPISRSAREVPLAPNACDFNVRHGVKGPSPEPPVPLELSVEIIPRLPPIIYVLPPPPRTRIPITAEPPKAKRGFPTGIERPPRG